MNASITEDSDIGRLMYDFRMSDARQMHNKELADSVRYFKEDEEGVNIMCDLVKEIFRDEIEEVREEGEARGKAIGKAKERQEIIQAMYKNGLDVEFIAKNTNMSIDEVEKIIDCSHEEILNV